MATLAEDRITGRTEALPLDELDENCLTLLIWPSTKTTIAQKETATDFIPPICCSIAVCHKVPADLVFVQPRFDASNDRHPGPDDHIVSRLP
jgi:hypothetical protein